MLKLITENNSSLRTPHPSEQKRNGFTKPPTDSGKLKLPTGKNQKSEPEHVQVSDEALHRYRQAMFILTQKDRSLPSLDQMNEGLKEPEDSVHVDRRIKKFKAQHLEDLQRLYTAHAAEYHEEMLHRYKSKDETYRLTNSENNAAALASYDKLQNLYRDTRNPACYELYWHDDISRLNHAYQQEIIYLRRKKRELRHREDEERKREQSQFPRNIAEWRTMPKDVQLRVAKFLTSDKLRQEKMVNEFHWAWLQVQPLKNEFSSREDFQKEVRALIAENEVKDPRARR